MLFDFGGEPRRWPELVGRNGSEVVEIIKRDTGTVRVRSSFMFLYDFDRFAQVSPTFT